MSLLPSGPARNCARRARALRFDADSPPPRPTDSSYRLLGRPARNGTPARAGTIGLAGPAIAARAKVAKSATGRSTRARSSPAVSTLRARGACAGSCDPMCYVGRRKLLAAGWPSGPISAFRKQRPCLKALVPVSPPLEITPDGKRHLQDCYAWHGRPASHSRLQQAGIAAARAYADPSVGVICA